MDALTVQPAAPRKWYEIWRVVWMHPGAGSFQDILKQEPDISYQRGFKWIGLTTLILGLVIYLASLVLLSGNNTSNNVFSSFASSLCSAIIVAPIAAIVGLAFTAGFYHGIAKLFGGNGAWGALVFCFAAIDAPVLLLSYTIGIVTVLASPVGLVLSCLQLGVSVLSLYMFASAISAVENLGTGKTIATVLTPVIAAVVLVGCLASLLPSILSR